MDKELLARKLYIERVEALLGEQAIDVDIIEEMWDSRASPCDAVKAMLVAEPISSYGPPLWLARYLNRK